jgi:hypothetical protein
MTAARITGARLGGPAALTLFDNRSPRIVVLPRKGRTISYIAEEIEVALVGGAGIAAGHARTGCWAQAGFLAMLSADPVRHAGP